MNVDDILKTLEARIGSDSSTVRCADILGTQEEIILPAKLLDKAIFLVSLAGISATLGEMEEVVELLHKAFTMLCEAVVETKNEDSVAWWHDRVIGRAQQLVDVMCNERTGQDEEDAVNRLKDAIWNYRGRNEVKHEESV